MQNTTQHSIVEPIGQSWSDELIWLPVPSTGHTRVVNAATGEALPTQICGPRVCVRVSLPANERLQLRFEPGAAATIASPFTLDGAEISNGIIDVRIPVTGSFDPVDAPGPVIAIRREGEWIGQGVWGTSAFTGRIETTITDRGPLFARWVVQYIIGGKLYARYECTIYAGEDFVRIHDETMLGAAMSFRFRLTGQDAPTEWFTYGGGEAVNVQRGPMDKQLDHKGLIRGNEFMHIDFNSGHFQMSYTWAGFIARGQAVGISEFRGGHWVIPGRNRIRIMKLADGVEYDLPVNGGSKEFVLACGDPAAYAPETGLSRFCHVRRKYSDIPLEKVRHWVTEWPLKNYDRPVLYPRGTAERWKEKLKAWPQMAEAYQTRDLQFTSPTLVSYMVRGDRSLLDSVLKSVNEFLDKAVDHVLSNGYIRLIIFDGRWIKIALDVIDVLRWRGELDEKTARSLARRAAFLAYCFADKDFWPWDSMFRDRDDPRSLGNEYWEDMGSALCPPNFSTEYYTSFGLIGLTYPEHPAAREWVDRSVELFERNLAMFFYENGAYGESVNYHTHVLSMTTHLAIGLFAAGERDFFEHPRFKRTFGYMIDMLSPPSALTDRGLELASAPQMLNPPKDRRGVMLTNWGNSGYDCSGYIVPIVHAIAAGIYADRDPAYAKRLMTAWRLSAQEFCTYYHAFCLVALGRPDLPDVPLELESKLVEGLGAVFRSGDVFGWVKSSTASNHNCYDEGGLVLYAHGAPLIGDFGYHTRHEGQTIGCSDTWKHACVSFGDRRSVAYLGAELRLPSESWRSTPEADLLVVYSPVQYLIPQMRYYMDLERIPRIEHRRYILFVKPHYFVIYDHIWQTTLPSTWWMHCLSDEIKIDERRARFIGRYGVDMEVQVLLPQPAKIEQGIFGVQQHTHVDQPGVGDYLTVISALPSGKQGPTATYAPEKRLLRIQGEWGEDHVVLSPEETTVEQGKVRFTGRVALIRNGTCHRIA